MATLATARAEPVTLRRGFKWTYRIQLLVEDADGNLIPQALTGFTITPQLRLTESRDATAISGLTPVAVTVDENAGIFDISVAAAESEAVMVVGKVYYWMVYVSHATVT